MIYDFQYLPYSLGDILTWTVHLTVQAQEAKWKPKEIRYQHQLRHPHPMQSFIKPGQGKKYLGELAEAFLFNPLNLKTVEENKPQPVGECIVTKYGMDLQNLREQSGQGIDIKKQNLFFVRHVASHEKLNKYYRQNGQIPLLKAPIPVATQTAKLIQQFTGKSKWICAHVRFRGIDKKWGNEDAERNGDPVTWFKLLQTIADSYRHTHAILLMGNIESYPSAFLNIQGVTSLRLNKGTLKNDLAAILGGEAFVGCSSGFAAAANFSNTPYIIHNVTTAGYKNYALEIGETKLPFAAQRQYLIQKSEKQDISHSLMRDVFPNIKRKVVRQRSNTRAKQKYNQANWFIRQAVIANVGLYKYADITIHRSYFEKLQELCESRNELFNQSFLDVIALKEEVFHDNLTWGVIRKINELREQKAEQILYSILKKKLIYTCLAFKRMQRARELSPSNVRFRAYLNLFRIAQKLSIRTIDKRILLGLMRLWEEWYLLFCQFRSSYRSKSLNP